jgi:hypothetical protein
MECLGLHNKPKGEVHPGHKLTGPEEEEEEEEEGGGGGGGGGEGGGGGGSVWGCCEHGNEQSASIKREFCNKPSVHQLLKKKFTHRILYVLLSY